MKMKKIYKMMFILTIVYIIFCSKKINAAKYNFHIKYKKIHKLLKKNFMQYIKMIATAYTPSIRGCDGCTGTGYTFTGRKAGYGSAAVDPRTIPLGTWLYIQGYGYALADDVGGAIKGNKIDLCFNSYKQAIDFGRKDVKVFIVSKNGK